MEAFSWLVCGRATLLGCVDLAVVCVPPQLAPALNDFKGLIVLASLMFSGAALLSSTFVAVMGGYYFKIELIKETLGGLNNHRSVAYLAWKVSGRLVMRYSLVLACWSVVFAVSVGAGMGMGAGIAVGASAAVLLVAVLWKASAPHVKYAREVRAQFQDIQKTFSGLPKDVQSKAVPYCYTFKESAIEAISLAFVGNYYAGVINAAALDASTNPPVAPVKSVPGRRL